MRLPSIDDCPACQRYGSTHRVVEGKLNQYFILTGTADVTIRTRVMDIIFTMYNREFCLSLWDPGGLKSNCATCLAVASVGSLSVFTAKAAQGYP